MIQIKKFARFIKFSALFAAVKTLHFFGGRVYIVKNQAGVTRIGKRLRNLRRGVQPRDRMLIWKGCAYKVLAEGEVGYVKEILQAVFLFAPYVVAVMLFTKRRVK